MKDMLREYLEGVNLFSNELPDYVHKLTQAVTGELPYKMKLSIAVSELVLFTSQLRRNIILKDQTQVPINSISFVLAGSGLSKDRAASAMRKCFREGYERINTKRIELAVEKAIIQARAEGVDDPDNNYHKFYHEPKPLFVATSTQEGLISHMNDLEVDRIGAASIYSGELGSELQTSSTIVDNIRLLAEMYDLGKKEVKVLKSQENQSKAINCLPFSALFMGSQENILYDEAVKSKFKLEFTTKLARRSFFNFNPVEEPKVQYTSVQEALRADLLEEEAVILAQTELREISDKVAQLNLGTNTNKPLPLTDEAQEVFYAYKRYNEEISESMSKLFPITKLVRKHAQWRALKLAGAFALFSGHSQIEVKDLKFAVTYVEMLDEDMMMFEDELRKEKYEQFVDFMKFIAEDGKASITTHKLRKMGYISATGNTAGKIRELVTLASSFDSDGIYTILDDGISYEEIKRTDVTGASWMECSGTKEERRIKCASGYQYDETTFNELGYLLSNDMAFCPFEFTDGVRNKDNVTGGTKWLCLDIDDSKITDEECHFMLQNINHHIARTSDPDNPFKFRLIVELDTVVDIDDRLWKNFLKSIGEYLAVRIDLLPKAQIYFGYAGRTVLSVTDQEVIEAKDHIMIATNQSADKPKIEKLTAKEKELQLDSPMDTFFYAFDADQGKRSLSLIRAAYHARDLGMSTDRIISLMEEINNYWAVPIEQSELEQCILSQVRRF